MVNDLKQEEIFIDQGEYIQEIYHSHQRMMKL